MPAILCVHPHPDDESISCGGTLARYADEGVRTMVVTCTGGEEGDNLAGVDLGDEEMAAVRRRELEAALAILGVSDHAWLGYRDSGMAESPANGHPDAFAAADTEEAAERLAAIIRRFRPDVVVSDDERGTYGHPDHMKAHVVTGRALDLVGGDVKWYVHAVPTSRLLDFQERMRAAGLPSPFGDEDTESVEDLEFGVPDEDVTAAIDVRPWLGRKQAALRAHASQIGEESFFLNLPEEIARDVFGTEFFSLRRGEVGTDGGLEDDLLAGIR